MADRKPNRFPAVGITMLDAAMRPAFEVIVYGCTASQVLRVPNPITPVLAQRYPGYVSSIMHVRDIERNF